MHIFDLKFFEIPERTENGCSSGIFIRSNNETLLSTELKFFNLYGKINRLFLGEIRRFGVEDNYRMFLEILGYKKKTTLFTVPHRILANLISDGVVINRLQNKISEAKKWTSETIASFAFPVYK